jgi:hypothetical protein
MRLYAENSGSGDGGGTGQYQLVQLGNNVEAVVPRPRGRAAIVLVTFRGNALVEGRSACLDLQKRRGSLDSFAFALIEALALFGLHVRLEVCMLHESCQGQRVEPPGKTLYKASVPTTEALLFIGSGETSRWKFEHLLDMPWSRVDRLGSKSWSLPCTRRVAPVLGHELYRAF